MTKPTDIALEPFDAALVIHADGTAETYLPQINEADPIPDHVRILAAVLCALHDEELRELICARFEMAVEAHDGKEEFDA